MTPQLSRLARPTTSDGRPALEETVEVVKGGSESDPSTGCWCEPAMHHPPWSSQKIDGSEGDAASAGNPKGMLSDGRNFGAQGGDEDDVGGSKSPDDKRISQPPSG